MTAAAAAPGVELALAAPSFHETSQTFVRNHLATIAPGSTVLICQDGTGAEGFGLPVLSRIDHHDEFDPETATLAARAANAVRARWKGYLFPGLRGADRKRVADFLRASRPRAVLAEFGTMAVQIMGACADAGAPLYAHFHGVDVAPRLRRGHIRAEYRALFAAAAGVIGPSRFIVDQLAAAGCPREKLHVSACGVDADRFERVEYAPLTALAIGRFVEKKAPHRTIAAFARALERHPDARLDMIGDGPLLGAAREQVAALGLGDRIVLHGARPPETVARMMGRAAVFLQHSVTAANGDTEGLPVVVLEAMSARTPVVSTRHSGIAEAVIDGETGLLVAEHDVEGMAAAISAVFDDPARGAAMGSRGRERVLAEFTHARTRDRLRAAMGLPPAQTPPAQAGLAPPPDAREPGAGVSFSTS